MRSQRRSSRARAVAARSGRSGAGGGSFVTGSDEDWDSEAEEAEADEDDDEAGGGELFGDKSVGNFTSLALKPDHANRPLWVCPDGRIFLETFSPIYKQAYDFLIAVAEPVCRPESVHEYVLTPHSLYAAVSVGLETGTIIKTLNTLSKVAVSAETARFIRRATQNYGKAKMVLKRNKFWVESGHREVLERLLADPVIADARANTLGLPGDGLVRSKALREKAAHSLAAATQAAIKEHQEAAAKLEAAKAGPSKADRKLEAKMAAAAAAAGAGADGGQQQQQGGGEGAAEGEESDPEDFTAVRAARGDGAGAAAAAAAGPLFGEGDGGGAPEEDPGREVLAFEVQPDKVEAVKKQCLPPPEGRLNYPLLEEYDFRADATNPTLPMELKPHVSLRPYQEKSLGKMFGNGRARSGIIVLPCGAGKSLVGVAAAARVKKSCLCLCTSSVSVDQWRHQFKLWSNLGDHQVVRFTSESREELPASKDCPVVVISTFTMISHSGKRSEAGEAVMRALREREWGLLLLDEVHVVPAAMFRKVIGIVKAHCKLGLTATLVREDERIGDLNFLIGPKLYEANWLDLTREGHIANVQCVEVWCPMAAEYMKAYLQLCDEAAEAGGAPAGSPSSKRALLYAMNPNKFFACQFLVWFHETHRNDKIIVFSDNIFALRKYAVLMRRPFIYGGTSHQERTRVLHRFKTSNDLNTVFLSKVGDNSLDIPEANVLIQISSHAGSRRQEAQRLGRILRAKKGAAPPGPGEFDAFFYTLVSRDTQEMFYSAKRQQFLIDQGYAFKIVEFLHDQARASDGVDGFRLVGATPDEQRNMLSTILEQGAASEGIDEVLEGDQDADDLVAHQGERRRAGGPAAGPSGARRAPGSLAAASGAGRAAYAAWPRGGGRGGGRGKRPLTQAEIERKEKNKRMRSRLAG